MPPVHHLQASSPDPQIHSALHVPSLTLYTYSAISPLLHMLFPSHPDLPSRNVGSCLPIKKCWFQSRHPLHSAKELRFGSETGRVHTCESLISFCYLLCKVLSSFWIRILVRMVLQRELAVCFADLLICRSPVDLQQRTRVSVTHYVMGPIDAAVHPSKHCNHNVWRHAWCLGAATLTTITAKRPEKNKPYLYLYLPFLNLWPRGYSKHNLEQQQRYGGMVRTSKI